MMNEQLSALVDGEIVAQEVSNEIALILSGKEAMQTWRDYQLIGDAMRSAPTLGTDFTARVMLALEQEPTVLAPNAMPLRSNTNAEQSSAKKDTPKNRQDRLPAVWSIAASCAAVLMVGWVLLNQQLQDFNSDQRVQIASSVNQKNEATQLAATAGEVQALPLEYLAAHQASAPSVGSYYIKTASYSE